MEIGSVAENLAVIGKSWGHGGYLDPLASGSVANFPRVTRMVRIALLPDPCYAISVEGSSSAAFQLSPNRSE